MEYLIFLAATLVLAVSFPHWEPTGRVNSAAGQNRLLGLTGVVGHLGGTAAIGWLSGFAAGAFALLTIPLAASILYTLIVHPLAKSIRENQRHDLPGATHGESSAKTDRRPNC